MRDGEVKLDLPIFFFDFIYNLFNDYGRSSRVEITLEAFLHFFTKIMKSDWKIEKFGWLRRPPAARNHLKMTSKWQKVGS